jgi:hypothetical protein
MEELEDTIWAEATLAAHCEGYIGLEESRKMIDYLLDAAH